MSSKVVSYYDWSIQFKNSMKNSNLNSNLNSIGIADDDFKNYLRKWKNRNLS